MNEYTLESFINFCDEYQIANESFRSIKSKLITGFSRLILWIESKVKNMKDNKVKSTLLKLLSRAKQGLAKSKSLNEHNPDMVKKLQEQMNEIKEETSKVDKYSDGIIINSVKNGCNDGDRKRVQKGLAMTAYMANSKSFEDFKVSLNYALNNFTNLYENDDGEMYDDTDISLDNLIKIGDLLIDNFSKKKCNSYIKIGNKFFNK